MQKTSSLYRAILQSRSHHFEYKVEINGVEYGNSYMKSLVTKHRMLQEEPTIGGAVAGEIDLTMKRPSAEIPAMAVVRPFVRICGMVGTSSAARVENGTLISQYATYSNGNITFSEESGARVINGNLIFPSDGETYAESEWIQQGEYFIDTREASKNNNDLSDLTIHGFDAMLMAEQPFQSNNITGDSVDIRLVEEIASIMEVEIDTRTYQLMDSAYMIPLPTGYTCREVLGYIAGLYVGCFLMSDEGKLRLVAINELPRETNLLIDGVGDHITFGSDETRILV